MELAFQDQEQAFEKLFDTNLGRARLHAKGVNIVSSEFG
jgi:hypothetical protein